MNQDQLFAMRHTAAHILAAAVKELYPEAQFGVGPVVEHGFYYDILTPEPISENDLKKIEKRMKKIIARSIDMERSELSIDETIEKFKSMNQPFKVELLESLKEKGTTKVSAEEAQDVEPGATSASVYATGEFEDLCRGPHIANTKEMGAFKLMRIAGAYWRGNEENAQMQRIYGVAFATKDELDSHIAMLEEAKKRDHRKLGAELDLFTFSELVGAGLPLFTPRGGHLRHKLDHFVWQLRKARGYERVEIPHITKKDLYETSGHWQKFSDELMKIETREDHLFAVKPMNCPHHTQIYARKKWSYRDLPQRYANTTMVYRDEQSGELQGLSRVRSITQDDAHVFCRESQVKEEAYKIWDIIQEFYGTFGFNLKMRLSTHDPENMDAYKGDIADWEKAVSEFESWLKEKGADYFVAPSEAAFYGPKIDFIATDSLGREWQVATIQVDRSMPESFDLVCTSEVGEDERIVMLHAAIMGSIERFLSILIEHVGGAFPFWLAPEQIRLVPVSDDFVPFASELSAKLDGIGVESTIDDSKEGVGKKIRNSAKMKTPWTIVIGEKEVNGGDFQVNVFGQEEDIIISQDEFLERCKSESVPQ
jgi:threonyl-tRNA synthetase